MKKIYLIIFILLANLSFASVEKYIEIAKDIKLYDYELWNRLLHYKRSKSLIVNDDFFLSSKGRYDRKEELIATIRAFYDISIIDKEGQPAICKYPARFDFLNKYLNFENLPKVHCSKYDEFFNEVKPESITLIFPTTYINNPASMFGHTLIRIDRENSYKNNNFINSIIINYGADTKGETNGISYAFKGVFGLYEGFFSATYYYNMVNFYNHLENRDIYEYKLAYKKEDVIFYTKHIWELMGAKIDYYFFKENCSYLILETLNVINKDDLVRSFWVETTPIDTIKLLKQNTLIEEVRYRPSLQRQISHASDKISKEDVKKIKNFINNDEELKFQSNLSYNIAYRYLEYNKLQSNISLQDYRKKSLQLLKTINSLETKEDFDNKYDIEYPEESHKLQRISLFMGEKRDRKYLELQYKPTYHELIDDGYGFDLDSEISFFNFDFKYYYDEENRLNLDYLNFIKIKSLPKHTTFFSPTSFTVLFAIQNLYEDRKVLLLDVNGGATLGGDVFSIFCLLGPTMNSGSIFEDYYSLNFNEIIGLRFDTKYIKTIIDFRIKQTYPIKYNYHQLNIENNIILNKNLSLGINFNKNFYRKYKNESNLNIGFKLYF